ncbi:MAG: hypothetical protein ACXVCY_03780 [Pseudobdellovibrionaceae bacterium]
MKSFIIFVILFQTNVLFADEVKTEPAKATPETWRAEMQIMKSTLTDLLPYASNSEAFNAPQNAMKIQDYLQKLTNGAKTLTQFHGQLKNTQDPTVGFVAQSFESNMASIQESISKGRRDYARFLILNTMSYCIECHTRTNSGPQFFGSETNKATLSLDPVERVEYYISTRQFKDALKTIEDTLKQNKDTSLFANEKLIRYGITLTVKYFQDPAAALKLLKLASSTATIPFFLKRDIKSWEGSLNDWKKEKSSSSSNVNSKIELAKNFISKAENVDSKLNSLHAGDVLLLRANAILTGLFNETLTTAQKTRVLFLIGESYRLLPEHLFWTLHESYYEACIRTSPHTIQAERCYDAFEDSVLQGYTGSAGTYIPESTQKQLNELKKLATKKEEKEKEN